MERGRHDSGARRLAGMGFLGAGTILHFRGTVHGLTTAASLWVTAAIGTAVGVGMYLMSNRNGGARVGPATVWHSNRMRE